MMSNFTIDRRELIKRGFLAGVGTSIVGSAFSGCGANSNLLPRESGHNMSGYRAPKIPVVRIGFIGLGMRGPGAVERMMYIEGVEIAALGDKRKSCTDKVETMIAESGLPQPAVYSGSEDVWKQMCQRDDLDLIYIATPWDLHTPMAVYAMEHGKHAATEGWTF